MSQWNVEIVQARPDRLSALASVLGRAFAVEPMMRWPLCECDDVEERLIRAFGIFMEDPIRMGMVWEAGAAAGALIWIPAGQMGAVDDGNLAMRRVYEREDGARRFDRFWDWSGDQASRGAAGAGGLRRGGACGAGSRDRLGPNPLWARPGACRWARSVDRDREPAQRASL